MIAKFVALEIWKNSIYNEILCTAALKATIKGFNPLTPDDLRRRRAVNPLNIKILSKKSRQAALRGGI
jgi:hypothetical protein